MVRNFHFRIGFRLSILASQVAARVFIVVLLVFLTQIAKAHSGSDLGEEWADKFYRNFIRYHHQVEQNNSGATMSHSSIRIWGQKFPLNNEFYELMRLSLSSVASEYNEFCDTCLVDQVKQKSADVTWIQSIEDKINSLTEMRASISGVKKEYGNMALVGYVIMEMLEHTFLGPLGVCPILNVIYFSSLDVFKSMIHVFRFSRDFRLLGVPSLTQSIETGVRIFLFKKRATKVYYEFNPQMREVLTKPGVSEVTAKHLNQRFKPRFFWHQSLVTQIRVSVKDYKKLSKNQGRKRWLYWQTELQSLYSRRLLWPIAYQELILNPSLDSVIDYDVTHKPIRFSFEAELKKIFSVTEAPQVRFASAMYLHEYYYVMKKTMIHLLAEDLEHKRISRQQYLETYKDISSTVALQSEFTNYLLTASLQTKDTPKLKAAFKRAQDSLKAMERLVPILESWFEVTDRFSKDRWQLVQNELKSWHDQEVAKRPWIKPRVTLWNRPQLCRSWLLDK